MTAKVAFDTVDFPGDAVCARLTLAGGRANSLEPELLGDLVSALDRAEEQDAKVILICGGRNFSSGGDVRGFHAATLDGSGQDYARAVVPLLQTIVARPVTDIIADFGEATEQPPRARDPVHESCTEADFDR